MVQVLVGGRLYFSSLISLISVLLFDAPVSCTFVPCQSISRPYLLLNYLQPRVFLVSRFLQTILPPFCPLNDLPKSTDQFSDTSEHSLGARETFRISRVSQGCVLSIFYPTIQ